MGCTQSTVHQALWVQAVAPSRTFFSALELEHPPSPRGTHQRAAASLLTRRKPCMPAHVVSVCMSVSAYVKWNSKMLKTAGGTQDAEGR